MKILPSYATVGDRGAGSKQARTNAGASFRQRGSRPEVLPGSTSRGGRRQQQHPWGKGKKGEKDELCSERLQTTVFSSRLAGKTLNPLFAGIFNDKAL